MGHDHAHHRSAAGDARALSLTLGLVLLVLVAELAGGLLSGSLALLSDAAHMFTDAAALAIALVALRVAERPPDHKRSFGYHRFEVLAALANALLLMLAAAYILYEAWRRLGQPAEIEAGLMLWIAVLGLAVNLAGMRLLAGGREHNLNIKGAYLEVWSDMLGSVGVIVGALVIRLTGWTWVDSAVAVAIGLWVLPRTWQLLRASLNVLLEGVPEGVSLTQVEQALRGCEGVAGVHDLHVWSIASGRVSLSVHAVMTPPVQAGDATLQRMRAMLAERFGIHHSTVQLEMATCEQQCAEHGFGPARTREQVGAGSADAGATQSIRLNPGIFKAYDIRGVVPSTVNEELAQALGRAFGTLARREGENTVAVGRDGRLSGPALADALIRGLLASGVDVIDVGQVTTPMLYFATNTLARSGIQVTASHNPKDHNGFKLVLAGRAVYGEELQGLRQMMEAPDPDSPPAPGKSRTADIFDAYRDRIVSGIELARPLKIVLDCGNGVAGASSPRVYRAIGCEVAELYSEVDGNFPNHHPDPGKPENLRDLIAAVKLAGADVGLALDGDGDRLGVVTRDGNIVYPDRQMMLFARDVLSRVPGATVLFDVKSTQRLAPVIAAAGGEAMMYKSGYALLKARMQELGAPLAGEMSGHIFFGERWYGFDDGTYAGCRLLEILSRHADASAVLDALPTSCSTPELHVKCEEGESHRVAAELVRMARFPDAQVCAIDGLRVDWPDGFGLVRASNTMSVLTLRFEGHTEEAQQRIQGEILSLLRSVKPDAQIAQPAH